MNITIHSMMSGQGFQGGAFSSEWVMSWVGMLIIVLIIMLGRKWFEEEEMLPFPYSFVGSLSGALIYFLAVTLIGSYKISLVLGLAGIFIGGWVMGSMGGGE